jgi:hypothetical protein
MEFVLNFLGLAKKLTSSLGNGGFPCGVAVSGLKFRFHTPAEWPERVETRQLPFAPHARPTDSVCLDFEH